MLPPIVYKDPIWSQQRDHDTPYSWKKEKARRNIILICFPDGNPPTTFREGVILTVCPDSQFPRLVLRFEGEGVSELEYHFPLFHSFRCLGILPPVESLIDDAERQRIGTGLMPFSFTMLPNRKPMVIGTLDGVAQNAYDALELVILRPIDQKILNRVTSMHQWLDTLWTQSNMSVTRECWYYADQQNYNNNTPGHRLAYYSSRHAPLFVPPWL